MADVVNLNRFRKRKQREAQAAQAASNRVKFGRTKEQKALDEAREEEARRRLDALRRDSGDEPPPAL